MRKLRLYDVLMIIDPKLGEEEVAQLSGRIQELLTGLGGEVVATEPWGKRRLAFELGKQREGSYLLMQLRATPATVREFERQLRLNEAVFRFMTTRVDPRAEKLAPPEPAAVESAAGSDAASGSEAADDPGAVDPVAEEIG